MHKHFLLLLLVSSHYFFGMEKQLSNSSIALDRQALWDHLNYPITPSGMLRFAQAKQEIQSNPDKAKQDLISLALDKEYPHVPAMRELLHIALSESNLPDAFHWANAAMNHAYPDPDSAVTLAGLLDEPSLAQHLPLSTRDRYSKIEQLLNYAALPKVMYDPENNEFHRYEIPEAHSLLQTFLAQRSARTYEIYEDDVHRLKDASEQEYPELLLNTLKSLKSHADQMPTISELVSKIIESDRFGAAKKTMPTARNTYELGSILLEFGNIKKIRQCAKGVIKLAAQQGDIYAQWKSLAVHDANSETAQLLAKAYENLKNTSPDDQMLDVLIPQALKHIEAQNVDDTTRAELGCIYATGLGDCEPVDEAKAVKYFTVAGKLGIERLIDYADTITKPEICLKAARHLYAHHESIDAQKFEKAVTHFLHHAKTGSTAVKKEVLQLLKNAKDKKAEYQIAQTARQFFADLADDENKWKQEQDFVNEVIDLCIARAVDNPSMKMHLRDLLEEYAPYIHHPAIPDPDARAQEYLCEVAIKDKDLGALLALEAEFSQVGSSIDTLTVSAGFWYVFWKKTASLPLIQAKAVTMMEQIVGRWEELVQDVPASSDTVMFDYYAMMVLANKYPEAAMRLFYRAEKAVKSLPQDAASLVKQIGAHIFIVECCKQKKGWGFFAQAVSRYLRRETDMLRPQKALEDLQQVSELLEKAQQSPEPFSDDKLLNQSMIDYYRGALWNNAAEIIVEDNAKKEARAQCLHFFEQAAQRQHPAASVEWALQALLTKHDLPQSQELLEKAVNCLIKGLQNNQEKARTQLRSMYKMGYTQAWCSGGIMTEALRERIHAALEQDGRLHPEVVEESAPVGAAPSALDRAIAFLNEKRYQEAYDLFNEESQNPNNLIAQAYLGIMHQQGFLQSPNKQEALRLFKKSLLRWDGVNDAPDALISAYAAVKEECSTDLEAAHATLHFIVHAYTQNQTPQRYAALFETLEKMESLVAKSKHNADKGLLFTSGVANRLINIYYQHHEILLLLELVSQYATRIHRIGVPADQEHMQQLQLPFAELSAVLMSQFISNKACTFLNKFTPEKTEQLIKNLELAVVKGHNPHIPLERVLGLLHLSRATGILNRDADNRKGLMWLQKAADYEDPDATIALGYIKTVGAKNYPELPKEPKKGVALLSRLAEQNYDRAKFLLALWFYEKKEHQQAEKYIKQIDNIDTNDQTAAMVALLRAKIYYEMPGLLPADLDKGLYLYNLCQVVRARDESLAMAAQLYQMLFTTKYPDLMPPEEIAEICNQILIANSEDKTVTIPLAEFLDKPGFLDALLKWADITCQKSAHKALFESIYAFLGCGYIRAGNFKKAIKMSGDKEYTTAHRCLTYADEIKGYKSLAANSLLFKLSIDRTFADVKEQLATAKLYFDKCRELIKTGQYSKQEMVMFNALVPHYVTLSQKAKR